MIFLLLLTSFSQEEDVKRLDFKILERFRKYLPSEKDHFKNLPEDLSSLNGKWATVGGYLKLRGDEDGLHEVLLLKSPTAASGIFDTVSVKFKDETKIKKLISGKYLIATGLFKIGHKAHKEGEPIRAFQLVDAVIGETAGSKKASFVTPSGVTTITYSLLEEAKLLNGEMKIPQSVQDFSGKWVTITGNMLVSGATEEIDKLQLAKNPWDGCCLGVPPTLFDTVQVKLKQGSKLANRYAVILTMSGIFKIKPEKTPGGFLVSLYTLEDAVEGAVPDPNAPAKQQTSNITLYVIVGGFLFFLLGYMSLKKKRISKTNTPTLAFLLLATVLIQSANNQDSLITIGDVVLANNPKDPFLQGQAIEKIQEAGTKAVASILEFVKKNGHNALTLQFTQAMESIKDEKIADLLAELVQNKKFFWRPAAMWGLATQSDKKYQDIYRNTLKDNLWGVRQAAIRGLGRINDKDSITEIRKLLADDIFSVRAQAAKTLHSFGDETGLPVLIASLHDESVWFDIDYGLVAREESWNVLKKITNDDFGYKPWKERKVREPGLAKWEDWISKKFPNWKEMVPKTAWFKPDDSKYTFGFELRSCQIGDFFFRVDKSGTMSLGCFNVTRAKLDDDEFKKFKEMLKPIHRVDPEAIYGKPGCDFEKYYLISEHGGFETRSFYIEGRPTSVDKFIDYCESLVRKKFGDGPASEFKEMARLFMEKK